MACNTLILLGHPKTRNLFGHHQLQILQKLFSRLGLLADFKNKNRLSKIVFMV